MPSDWDSGAVATQGCTLATASPTAEGVRLCFGVAGTARVEGAGTARVQVAGTAREQIGRLVGDVLLTPAAAQQLRDQLALMLAGPPRG